MIRAETMKTLLLFAHPAQQHSRTNRYMIEAARRVPGVTCVDMYAECPSHDFDVDREQQRLLEHDLILFQFPLYWYSPPPIIKEWQDLVLEHGFAYGEAGTALKGKYWLCAMTAGAPQKAYSPEGRHRFTLRQMLTPLEATANLCGMLFLAPYVLFGALGADDDRRHEHVQGYVTLLEALRDDRVDFDKVQRNALLTTAELGTILT